MKTTAHMRIDHLPDPEEDECGVRRVEGMRIFGFVCCIDGKSLLKRNWDFVLYKYT